MTEALGVNWTPEQYAFDAGWDFPCIEATAEKGIVPADAEGLTDEQQAKLLAYCRDQVVRSQLHESDEQQKEWLASGCCTCCGHSELSPRAGDSMGYQLCEECIWEE